MIWLALVFAFAIYWPSLHGDYLLDDLPGLQAHPRIWTGKWRDIRAGNWRSIAEFTMSLQVAFTGPIDPKDDPAIASLKAGRISFAFHVGNVILHALTALVVGQILGLKEPGLAPIAALLWVAMPIAVNAVAYMSSRATLLAGLFAVASLYCVLSGWTLIAVPLCLLALMSKEDHAALPFGLAGAAVATHQYAFAVAFVAFCVMLAIYYRQRIKQLLRCAVSPKLTDAGIPQPFPAKNRRLTIWTELILRFPQWVAGTGYCIAPAFRSPSRSRIFGAFAVVGGTLALGFFVPEARLPLWLLLTSPLPLYALFIQVRDAVMDYRAYSAMIGPFLLIVPLVSAPVLIAVLLAWAVISAFRAFDWRTPMELWSGAVRDGGGPVAWINLGSAYQMRREFDEARRCYAECLRDYPDTGVAILNLAMIEGMEGRPDGARALAEECVRLNPRYLAGWTILRQVYDFLHDSENSSRCEQRIKELTA